MSNETESLDSLYDEWVAFADKTFGTMPARRCGVLEHLVEEVDELYDAVVYGDVLSDAAMEEAADVFILLSHLTSDDKVRFLNTIRRKIDKNYVRTWSKPDGNGVIRHVKGIHD